MRNILRFLKEIALLARGLGIPFAINYVLLTISCLPEVISSGSLYAVDKKVKSILDVKSHGFRFRFLPVAISVVRELHLHDCYGFDARKRYGVIMDLGANCGTFTALASKVADKVISVECNTAEMPALFKKTMEMNNITNAVFVNRFVSNDDTAETVSIARLIKDYGLQVIDYVKMDIEGAEKQLFKGSPQWLNITRQISMEVHPCFGVDEQKIINTLGAFGFTSVLLDKNYNTVSKLDSRSMGYIRALKE